MLSICIPLKNRVTNLTACLQALDKLTGIDEVVIGDFNSTDTNFQFLNDLSLNVKVVPIEGDFSIGKAKNVAAEHASGDILFFLDADLITPQPVIDKILKLVPLGFVYCPIMWIEQGEDDFESHWAVHGRGQIAVSRDQWLNHKWVEWNSYGGDDNMFFEPYKETAIVDLVDGFIHQWHHNNERTKHYTGEIYSDLRAEERRRQQ